MKRPAALLAPLAFVAACSSSPSVGERRAGIINGTDDPGDPGVVMVLAQTGSQMFSLCTGEVISPHVVLTAAHCLDPAVLMTTTAKFYVFINEVFPQASAPPPGSLLQVQATQYNTNFKAGAADLGQDVGVVILANPTTIAPLPYSRTPLAQSAVGQAVRVVGYGVTSGTDTNATSAGTRRTTPDAVYSIDETKHLVGLQDGTHGICEGDSGGPAFMTVGGKEIIVALTSYGNTTSSSGNCPLSLPGTGVAANEDTDVGSYTDFIDKWVTMYDPPAKGPGEQCASDADCAPRPCQQTSVGKICVQTCDPAAMTSTCPAGMQCTNVDGTNLCYTAGAGGSGGGKSGGCAVGDGATGGDAPLGGIALLLAGALALVLAARRRARA